MSEVLHRSAALISHHFMWLLMTSLNLLTGPHCGRFPVANCPKKICLGIRLSGMRMMWPTQCSCDFRMSASMPGIPHICSTSVFGILSCHCIPAILRRHRRWNWSSLRTEWRYSVQVSQPYSNVVSTTAYGTQLSSFLGHIVHVPKSALQFAKCAAGLG